MTSQYDKEIDQCPKCEGIWLGTDNSDPIFDFTDEGQILTGMCQTK
jgi:Zn-finger nucleic acid-binding protein